MKVQNTVTSCSNTDIDKVVSKPLALSIIMDISFSFVAYIYCLNSYPCHLYFGIIIFIFFSWLTDIIRRQRIGKGVSFKYEVVFHGDYRNDWLGDMGSRDLSMMSPCLICPFQ